MMTIDLIPTENINSSPPENEHVSPDEEGGSAVVSEPAGHQAEEPSEQSQKISSPEEVEPVTKQAVSGAQPKEKAKRGRPPGSKNKTPRKATVKLEPVPVEPLTPVKEENIEEHPPAEEPVISPRMQKREFLRQMAARRQEERKAKITHYTNLLDRSLGY